MTIQLMIRYGASVKVKRKNLGARKTGRRPIQMMFFIEYIPCPANEYIQVNCACLILFYLIR